MHNVNYNKDNLRGLANWYYNELIKTSLYEDERNFYEMQLINILNDIQSLNNTGNNGQNNDIFNELF